MTPPADLRTKTFSRAELRAVLPEGEDPIATRYDAHADKFHIACASGRVVAVDRRALEKSPIVSPFPFPDITPPLPEEVREFSRRIKHIMLDAARGIEIPDQNETPAPPRPRTNPDFTDRRKWELAEARCAEAVLAGAWNGECLVWAGCTSRATYMLVLPDRGQTPACGFCTDREVYEHGDGVLDCH